MRNYENYTEKLYNIVFKSQEEIKCQNKVNFKRNKIQELRDTLQTLLEQSGQKMLYSTITVQQTPKKKQQKKQPYVLYLKQNTVFKSVVKNKLREMLDSSDILSLVVVVLCALKYQQGNHNH